MVDGLLAGQDQVETFVGRVGRDLLGHLHGVGGLGINPHGLVGADGQAFADGGIGIGTTHGDGDHAASAGGFLEFQCAHQSIPLIVRVHDEGDTVGIVLCVLVGEGDACRGIGHLAE